MWSPCSAPRAPGSAAGCRSESYARKIRVYDPRTGWWLLVLPDAAFEVV
jgi:hypothetical protein